MRDCLLLVTLLSGGLMMLSSCSDKLRIVEGQGVTMDDNDKKAYREQRYPVIRANGKSETLTLRYYEDMPNVAYVSAADYHRTMLPGCSYRVERIGPGQYNLISPTGLAVVNTRTEVFKSPDYESFTNVQGLMQGGLPNVVFDGTPFVRLKQLEKDPNAVPITLEYGTYGIDLRGDDDNVYFPFATINDLYSDLSMHRLCFNGHEVVVIPDCYHAEPESVYADYAKHLYQETRGADLADYSYRNLCFTFDHFFGYPGRAPLDRYMRIVGLDKALSAQGSGGELVKTLLKSTNTFDYLSGMSLLNFYLNDGLHTILDIHNLDKTSHVGAFKAWREGKIKELAGFESDLVQTVTNRMQLWDVETKARSLMRKEAFGINDVKETYVKHGNTAICVLDSFMLSNLNEWNAYYKSSGPKPTKATCPLDPMVVFLDAINRAEEDPEVKNLIIDVTVNPGGSSDVVMACMSLIADRADFSYENVLTGQHERLYYDIDRNFDGKFDEKDREVKYHLNVAVLESRLSFSCGNMFSSLMKDNGYRIMGATSGGGSCAVQLMQLPEGYTYQMSTHRSRLCDKTWRHIDAGIVPDVAIAAGPEVSITIDGSVYQFPDFKVFYNLDKLVEKMQ